MIKVVHFNRKPLLHQYSIEKIVHEIKFNIPADIEVISKQSPFYSIGVFRRILNIISVIIRAEQVNHITGDVGYLCLGLPADRTILTIHDCVFNMQNRGLRKWIIKTFWYSLPLRRAKVITTISEFSKKEIMDLFATDDNNIHVIPNCISDNFQRYDKPFNNKEPVILQVGTKENKNLERVCLAVVGIKCKLVIVGKLTEKQKRLLQSINIKYNNIFNLTEDELIDTYRNSDIVVFSSLYEGFGLPILEANAIGRAIVTSNICSMPEVAGNSACLVDPYDVNSIRSGILRVIRNADYRTKLIENGFKNIKNYSSSKMANMYADIYRMVGEGL